MLTKALTSYTIDSNYGIVLPSTSSGIAKVKTFKFNFTSMGNNDAALVYVIDLFKTATAI